MINLIWSVLCRKSVVDSDSNTISIFDVFEQLTVEGSNTGNGPVNLPIDYEIVSLFSKEPGKEELFFKGDLKVEIFNPKGLNTKTFEYSFEMPKEMKRMRVRVMINGLVIDEDGVYNFMVSLKEGKDQKYKRVAELPLEVVIKK